MTDGEHLNEAFAFFTEIGIIAQLSSTIFDRCLPEGLSTPHFSILNHMVRLGDGRTPLQLAAAFQVTKPTMSHALKVLSQRRLIRLEPHPEDGRSKLVYLTEAGRAFRERAIAEVMQVLDSLATEAEIDAMRSLLPGLRRVRELLDQNRTAPTQGP